MTTYKEIILEDNSRKLEGSEHPKTHELTIKVTWHHELETAQKHNVTQLECKGEVTSDEAPEMILMIADHILKSFVRVEGK